VAGEDLRRRRRARHASCPSSSPCTPRGDITPGTRLERFSSNSIIEKRLLGLFELSCCHLIIVLAHDCPTVCPSGPYVCIYAVFVSVQGAGVLPHHAAGAGTAARGTGKRGLPLKKTILYTYNRYNNIIYLYLYLYFIYTTQITTH
jgi:hypothetical protein